MADNFLNDRAFLLKVNRHKHRIYYAQIQVLDFETEIVTASLEGKITGGSINISASSPTRRTGSLTILFDDDTKNISETSNLIAIDKKININIGISNPFYLTSDYQQYGKILWFKQGVFFITSASSSISASSCSVSIKFIDKMGALNGVCGGTFPASTTLSEILIVDKDGNQSVSYPLIKDIISEMVHHFGGEHFSRISIENVDDVGRQIVKWKGETPIWFHTGGTDGLQGTFEITTTDKGSEWTRYLQNEIIGYAETDLTYPGELTMSAGQTVTQALDKIVSALGNYEYFYDTEGIFHFRQKQNYEATGNTPLIALQNGQTDTFDSLYTPIYSDTEYYDEFLDNELIISMTYNANYSNIKNDFVCWGSGASKNGNSSNSSSNATWVRYHLAIDERPKDVASDAQGTQSLCRKWIYVIKDLDTDEILRYQDHNTYNASTEKCELLVKDLSEYYATAFDWREELYRRALLAYGNSTEGSYYDEELLAEWRKLYDPTSSDFSSEWAKHSQTKDVAWAGYNPEIVYAPDKIDYWLDIIDKNTNIGKYSVSRIGRRTKATVNSKADKVFSLDIPDIVFIKNTATQGNSTEVEQHKAEIQSKMQYYISIGQCFALMTPDQWNLLSNVNDTGSCYEDARQALYDNIALKSTVNLTCIPIFYLDVNKVILLNQVDLGIKGSFIINQISWQFSNTKTMSLSLQETIVAA